MRHLRRASPLHAARAAAGAAWCGALAAGGLLAGHPALLVALALIALAGAALARVGGAVARALVWTLPLALLVVVVNPFVSRQGVTVIFRAGEVPPFGQVDLTLEAVAFGATMGLRLLVVLAASALLTVAVDPDGLLAAFRRISLRSALAAALAVRLVPVLAADARRLDEARRCRATPVPRIAVLRAVAGGALDRSLDVAATLEVRGYAGARRPARGLRPWSRHDVAFLASALVLLALVITGRSLGWAAFQHYPTLESAPAGEVAAFAAVLAAVALAPFAQRRGIEP